MTENLENLKRHQSKIDLLKIQVDHEKAEVERLSGLLLKERYYHHKTLGWLRTTSVVIFALLGFAFWSLVQHSRLMQEMEDIQMTRQIQKKIINNKNINQEK